MVESPVRSWRMNGNARLKVEQLNVGSDGVINSMVFQGWVWQKDQQTGDLRRTRSVPVEIKPRRQD